MPLYDYRCGACKKTNEYLVANSESHPLECSCCHKLGFLERAVAHSFNANTSSRASGLSVQEQMRMRGGKQIAKVIAATPSGTRTYGLYQVPDSSNN